MCIALTALTVAAAALSAQLCVVYKTVFCAHICILCRKLYFVHTVVFCAQNCILCTQSYSKHTWLYFIQKTTVFCVQLSILCTQLYFLHLTVFCILFNTTVQLYFWNKSLFQANNTVISFVHSIFWRRKIYLVIYNCI